MEDILKLYIEHTRDIEPIQKLHAALAPYISADLIPLVVMGSSLLIAIVIVAILTGACSRRKKSRKALGNTVVIVGDCKSGKTLLFNKLCYRTSPPTVTSMKVNEDSTTISQAVGGGKGGEGGKVSSKVITLVDLPGHSKLRSFTFKRMKDAAVVIFMVDSVGVDVRRVAEFIYDLFTNKHFFNRCPPVLFACNKSDSPNSLEVDDIKKALEKELEKLKFTKNTIETVGAKEDAIVLGTDDLFSFDADAPGEVSFQSVSVLKDKDLDIIKAFIMQSI